MSLAMKRKHQDDFIRTLSSDLDEGPLEEIEPRRPRKQAKVSNQASNPKKKAPNEDLEGSNAKKTKEAWESRGENDGSINPDFEFSDDASELGDEEAEEWSFEVAEKGVEPVNLDEIIRRKKQKRDGPDQDEHCSADNINDSMSVDHADEVTDDASGTSVDSEANDSDDEDASDDDSAATPVSHPHDHASDTSDSEDAEEQAKRVAFFSQDEIKQKDRARHPSSFLGLNLSRPIVRALTAVGFYKPTPIQCKTIPFALMGKDIVGGAVTGSGKTAAFLIPILERLIFRPNKIPTIRVVVLTPTRELAMQCQSVGVKLAKYTDATFTLAVGGLSSKVQEAELRRRPDVVIATPGRFIDHLRNSPGFNVDTVEILVLDEADRMLEDGFADELNEILSMLPKSRQTMLFSATMTSKVDELIRVGLKKPVRLMVDSHKKTVTTLVQEFVRLRPQRAHMRMAYLIYICKTLYHKHVIVFFRQKKEVHKARIILGYMGLTCVELHGSMSQAERIASVEKFRDGKVSYLLATDVISRGLDIKEVDTVINYEAPSSLDVYVHRVGRTARAGRKGKAITLAAEADRKVVKAVVKAGNAQGAKIVHRKIPPEDVDKLQLEIEAGKFEIDEIMQEEEEAKQLAKTEMQVKKAENMIKHEAEIKARPKRTWFQTQDAKGKARDPGKDGLDRLRETLKKKTPSGRLSNKDKKKLDARSTRIEGRLWEKRKGDAAAADARAKARKQSKGKAKSKGSGKI